MLETQCRLILFTDDFLELSDEEVLPEDGYGSSSQEEDEEYSDASLSPDPAPTERRKNDQDRKKMREETPVSQEDEDEDVNGWGASRKDYYDADVIETEADALEEEKEARRLQQKQLQKMTEADFGIDEMEWKDIEEDQDQKAVPIGGVLRESLPKAEITDSMSIEERSQIMRSRYPEFEPLAKDFLDLQVMHAEMSATVQIDTLNHEQKPDEDDDSQRSPKRVEEIRFRALSAYLAALSMYFAVLTAGGSSNGKAVIMSPEEIRIHPVMETLLSCRNLWERLKIAKLPKSSMKPVKVKSVKITAPVASELKNEHEAAPKKAKKHDQSTKRVRQNKPDLSTLKSEAEALREERLRQAEESLMGLSTLEKQGPKSKHTASELRTYDDSGSDFGDQTSLTALEAAEKARRKKSLQFYTSQLAQKSKKRDEAGRGATGDADLPYKETRREQQQRLAEQAERRNDRQKQKPQNNNTTAEGDLSSDEGQELSNKQRQDAEQASDSEEDYYDLVAQRTATKKAAKSEAAARTKAAALAMTTPITASGEVEGETDGKRGLTYAIAANKGLQTHRRKKEARNPRVKKRKRFEDKTKKLQSVRGALYKGEREGRGGYGGEKTGINRGLVKSVKL